MLSKVLEIYARKGQSLNSIGICEAAIPVREALEVLEIMKNYDFIVLGGDLYTKDKNNNFTPYYANWYYEGNDPMASIETSINYLKNFLDCDSLATILIE